MAKEFQFDVFLSHNAQDKPRVRKLAERLRDAGLRVWFDEWIIKAGDDIYLAVERGLEAARVQVLCLSPAALGSNWVTLERSTVLFRDPTNAGRRFIPLLLADCDLPDALRRYKYVDFRQEVEAALEELLANCRADGEPPPPAAEMKAPKKSAEGSTKQPVKTKAKPEPSPEQAEPLAVLERKLIGQSGTIVAIAASGDKRFAVTADWGDNGLTIWDLANRGQVKNLAGHKSTMRNCAITPDGSKIVSIADDHALRIWSSATGETERVINVPPTYGLAIFPDGRRAVTAEGGGDIVVWDLLTGARLETLHHHSNIAWGVAVSPKGEYVLSTSWDETVAVWSLVNNRCIAELRGHRSYVRCVAINSSADRAISGGDDRLVLYWDLVSHRCIGSLEGHLDGVSKVAFLSNDEYAISTASDALKLWHLPTGNCVQTIPGRFYGLSMSHDYKEIFAGCGDDFYIYRLTGVRPVPSAEATRRYVNAKVVLLGEGTVGKTSLAHRLVEDCYVVSDRTHGMNVWRLELPQGPHPGPLRDPFAGPHPGPLPGGEGEIIEEREALLWDLAGQEDYRLIHQLFLEETALALLLINPQKDDPFAEAGDWLKALKTAAGSLEAKREAARLLIFSQIDVGGMKVGNSKIERFREQYGFAGWLPTSAKTGENCSDTQNGGKPSKLKQLIAESIPWAKLPWTSTPKLLAEVKNAVMSMRDESDIRLLRFAELAQRLEQALPGEKIGESDVRTAVTLLANHGLARPLKFGDLVLLSPGLLNGYAGAIIRAARAHRDEIGCVSEADIYKPEFDFTGVERLKHRPDEELLLRALVQTFLDNSLCIAEETPQGRHLVFPSQYRREKDTPKNPDIFVSYTFSGEWQTVWTTLVVRLWYSQEFEHRELWRNAADFASSKGHTLGLLIKKAGDGEATLSLYFDVHVPDELKVIFIEYVHRHLARYACDVGRDRRYVCPQCQKPVTDLDAVRKRLAARKEFVTCQECDEKVPLIDFIEQRLKSDPVARKILAMDATATRELDTQALEQILIGHMLAICGEANQIFRPVTMFDYGIDGELEFKDNDGKASGKRIYVQLKSGNSYFRERKGDGSEVFDVKNDRHLEYWVSQPVDVYLVIRQKDEISGEESIRWMNLTRYLKNRKDKKSRQIVFEGEKLDMEAVWRVRDAFFPPGISGQPSG